MHQLLWVLYIGSVKSALLSDIGTACLGGEITEAVRRSAGVDRPGVEPAGVLASVLGVLGNPGFVAGQAVDALLRLGGGEVQADECPDRECAPEAHGCCFPQTCGAC